VRGGVDFKFDANARCPRWERFLKEVFPGDPESQMTIEEQLGYGMTNDTRFEKGALWIGVKRSGKSTLAWVQERLAGVGACVTEVGMRLPCFADPENLEAPEEPVVPEGETSLQLLQAIYKDKKQPLNVRVRCAIEALPFEVPKLSATAVASMDEKSFAAALDRAIERSQSPPRLNGTVEQLPAEELKRPMSRYRRF